MHDNYFIIIMQFCTSLFLYFYILNHTWLICWNDAAWYKWWEIYVFLAQTHSCKRVTRINSFTSVETPSCHTAVHLDLDCLIPISDSLNRYIDPFTLSSINSSSALFIRSRLTSEVSSIQTACWRPCAWGAIEGQDFKIGFTPIITK